MPDIYENNQTCRPNLRLGTWSRNCMHLFYDCTQKDQQKWSTALSFGINTTNISDFSRMSHIRVSDYCLTPTQQFFSYRCIMARTSFWWYDEVRFVLDQHAELDIYSASSLKQQSTGRHVAPLVHIIPIPSQPVFALTSECCMLNGEATNTNFIVFGLTSPGLEPTIYHGEYANHSTTDAVCRT
jgi:hypothetical protein